jgi:hypothetical protein
MLHLPGYAPMMTGLCMMGLQGRLLRTVREKVDSNVHILSVRCPEWRWSGLCVTLSEAHKAKAVSWTCYHESCAIILYSWY